MAQSVKCSLCTHRDLSLIPSACVRSWECRSAFVVQCWEDEEPSWGLLANPSQTGRPQVPVRDPVSRKVDIL